MLPLSHRGFSEYFSLVWIFFTIQGHPLVKTKMCAVGHTEFLTFDRITIESYVIPHFWLIWGHWFYLFVYFHDSRSSRGQNQDDYCRLSWIFNFWDNSPRIFCNTSFLTNMAAPITLKWLFYVTMPSRGLKQNNHQ